ncbi:hypothetical protein P7L78_25890 [Tistrella bauzanensis]
MKTGISPHDQYAPFQGMSSASLPANRWFVLVAVMLTFLPVVLDMTILHVAVPTLTQSLNASDTEVLWIIDTYPLLMAGLLVPMATLADPGQPQNPVRISGATSG